MAEIVRLSEWPFDDEEQVTLWWLRSPWRESIHRQWRTSVVFKRQSGEFREVDFPWGLVPWLRLGQVFQAGQPLWNEAEGEIFELAIPDSSMATLSRASAIPTLANYLLEGESNLAEYCVKFQTQHSITIVIPVLECIRAFLIPNKTLAFGLLEPNYFERVIVQNEIKQGKLSLGFSGDMPKKILSRSLVFRIARLLYDSSFRSAWDIVYRDRFSQASQDTWNTSIPLTTSLPKFASTWHVRGLLTGQILLIQQIVEVAPTRSLPFTELEFTHPRIKKREYVEKPATKRQRKKKVVKEYVIESEAQPPEDAKPIQKLPRLRMAIIEKQKLKISQTGLTSITTPKRSSDAFDTADGEQNSTEPSLKSQPVNFSDTGQGGETPAAEFLLRSPLAIFVAPDDGLDEFAEAIRFLDEMHWDATVIWEVQEFARETPFAKVADRSRKYALVTLRIQGLPPCWILEFGRPDDYSISTLIFTFAQDRPETTLEAVINKMLDEALQPNGGWNSRPLKKFSETITGFNFRWAKHTKSSTEEWGERLYKSAKEVAISN
ncbi:hypothetical protein H6F89_03310 [Cyanobacteria bacterium FACHB-63]|nr:hypothetical protein [Cyanobacteria bacterium FACHB-63]